MCVPRFHLPSAVLHTRCVTAWQIFCVFIFLIAVSLFGTLISQLNEIVASQAMLDVSLVLFATWQWHLVYGGVETLLGMEHRMEGAKLHL
jgi:hypothetical protein